MLVVLPYCSTDAGVATKLLRWIGKLNDGKPISNHYLLLVPSSDVPTHVSGSVEKSASIFIVRKSVRHGSESQTAPFPRNANETAKSVFEWAALSGERKLFWLPTNALPIAKGWLDRIDKESAELSKPYYGIVIDSPYPHLGECGVWNSSISRFSQHIWTHPKLVWWMNTKDLVSMAVRSHLSAHIAEPELFAPDSLNRVNGAVIAYPIDSKIVMDYHDPKPKATISGTSEPCSFTWDVPVTILMPMRRSKHDHLLDCWKSILAQTHRNWNLVIVNDGENEPKADQLLSCIGNHSRVTIINGNRKGLPAALNLGMRRCDTELIARMDVDDVMMPNRLELQVNEYASDSRLDVLGGGIEAFGNANWQKINPRNIGLHGLLESQWGLSHPTVMYRRSSVRLAGGYNERCLASEDLELWCRMAAAGMRLSNTQTVLTKYRVHDSNKCIGEDRKGANKYILDQYRKPIKVGFITRMLAQGGAERWLWDCIRATSKVARWTVCVEVPAEPHVVVNYEGICEFHNTVEPDALNGCDVLISWCQFDPYRFKSSRHSYVCHTGIDNQARDLNELFASYVSMNKNARSVGVSNSSCAYLKKMGFQTPMRIELGLHNQHYQNPIVNRTSWRYRNDVDGFAALYLGRFSPEKNIDELALAFSEIDGTLIAVGQAWPPDQTGACVSDLLSKSNGKFQWLGWRNDISESVGSSDVFVLPSLTESASYCLLEAWVSGVPAIATRVGYAADNPNWMSSICGRDAASIRASILSEQLNPMTFKRRSKIADSAKDRYGWERFSSDWSDYIIDLANS